MHESPLALHRSSPADLQERNRVALEGLPFLVLRDDEDRQRIVRLEPDRTRLSVGRLEDSDVSLHWDSSVSRLHAVLERIGGEWTLVDDGLSANGSFVNEARVTGRQRLRDGDVLRFGRALVAFCDPGERDVKRTSIGTDLATLTGVTEAQRRVLVALCRPYSQGRQFASPASTAEIAAELYLSQDAIKTHLRNLYAKFDLDDLPHKEKRAALAERALATGVVSGRDYASAPPAAH
jgi:pSer/pThr/pTyr-binding forkhead associated (FHA) protein